MPQASTQQSNIGTTKPKEDGISIDYFKKNCSFLSGSLEEINERILIAQGKKIKFCNGHL